MTNPKHERTAPAHPVPAWAPIAGAAFGAATLIFFMGLIVMSMMGRPLLCENRFLVIITLAFGAAMGSSFLGGSAAASGSLPIRYAESHPVSFSVAGGIAVLILVLFFGNYFYGSDKCSDIKAREAVRGSVILRDGFSHYDQSGFRFAKAVVVGWDANTADILAAKPPDADQAMFFLPYDAEHFKNPELDRNAVAGIARMDVSAMDDVSTCPSEGYKHHWFRVEAGQIYCIRTRSGKDYVIIRVDTVEPDRIGFDYVYRPRSADDS